MKGYVPNWPEEDFIITKIKNAVPWTYVISNLKGKEMLKRFTKKNCKKQISSIYIEGPRTKLFIYFFSCVLGEQKREKRTERSKKENKKE